MYVTVIPSLEISSLLNLNSVQADTFITELSERLVSYGRDALSLSIAILNLKIGDEILLPATLCEVVLLPFIKFGIHLQYYSLDETLEFNIEEIKSRINPSTRAIYVNHFLGRPADINGIRNLCDQLDLFLIEDCAHAFGGSNNRGFLGNTGDVAIFSLRKFLPIPNGGALKINRADISSRHHLSFEDKHYYGWQHILKLVVLSLASKGLFPLTTFKNLRGDIENYLQFEDKLNPADYQPPSTIYSLSRWLIRHTNTKEIIESRQKNYRFWQSHIPSVKGLKPLFPDLIDGQNPFCYPILAEKRNELVRAMALHGFYLEPTITPPYRSIPNLRNPNENFMAIEKISKQMASLPVHQALDINQLKCMLHTLKKITQH